MNEYTWRIGIKLLLNVHAQPALISSTLYHTITCLPLGNYW